MEGRRRRGKRDYHNDLGYARLKPGVCSFFQVSDISAGAKHLGILLIFRHIK